MDGTNGRTAGLVERQGGIAVHLLLLLPVVVPRNRGVAQGVQDGVDRAERRRVLLDRRLHVADVLDREHVDLREVHPLEEDLLGA